MKTAFLPILLSLVAGAFMPLQAGINATLRKSLSDPVQAAFVSFLVGTLALAALMLVMRVKWPSPDELVRLPFWLWLGGLFGAFFVVATIFLVPRLGAATMMAFILAGQVIASLLFDQYGMLGYPVHPLSAMRLVGVGLLVAGVALVKMY
jgi:transporter family-2 protein